MNTAFRFLMAIIVAMMATALAHTASAQAPTVTPTEPQPVPVATMSKTHIGFSQGVFANWFEDDPSAGTTVSSSFNLSGGWDYEQSTYPQQAGTNSWKVKEYWYSFTSFSCPREGGYCTRLAEEYGPATAEQFKFEGNKGVTFSGAGLIFSFTADPTGREGFTQEMNHNQTVTGPYCWYSRQNAERRGSATLTLPDGTMLSSGQQSNSAYFDWNAEFGEGEFYFPSCAPYVPYYGGKG